MLVLANVILVEQLVVLAVKETMKKEYNVNVVMTSSR